MSKLLSLDQSSKCTGYAIFEDGKLIDYGHISLNNQELGVRLNRLSDWLINIIEEEKIDEVILEDIQLQDKKSSSVQFDKGSSNVKTYRILAEVIGVIEATLTRIGTKYCFSAPASWKSKLGIFGGGRPKEKKKAQEHVLQYSGKTVTQDEADAICIGLAHYAKENVGFDWSE